MRVDLTLFEHTAVGDEAFAVSLHSSPLRSLSPPSGHLPLEEPPHLLISPSLVMYSTHMTHTLHLDTHRLWGRTVFLGRCPLSSLPHTHTHPTLWLSFWSYQGQRRPGGRTAQGSNHDCALQ